MYYRYLNQSGCISIQGINESEELKALKSAFKLFEIKPETMDSIFGLISAVLHLGNVTFKDNNAGFSTIENAASGLFIFFLPQILFYFI
jgi:myosin heavy subunit